MLKPFSFALLLGIFLNTPAQNSIAFQTNLKEAVNKNIFSPSSSDRIVVRGSFEGWNSNNHILRDDNADSIFSEVFNIRGDPKSVIEYKYVILKRDGKVICESNPNPDNFPYGNRKLVLTGNPQLLSIETFQLDSDILQNKSGKTIFSIKQLQNDFIELKAVT